MLLIQECHDIERLCRMWPDQAAAEAKSSWLTLFAQFDDPVPWDEISENVKQGNVVGSGCGYSLLHAFVKHGHELAVMLLISKGADVNALQIIMQNAGLYLNPTSVTLFP
jgi:hypothetical protein